MKTRAILTGSSGFIGRSMVVQLKKRGYEVFEYDVKDGQDLAKDRHTFPEVEVIFHMAATNGTRLFYEKPSEVLKNNTLLTFCFDDYMMKFPKTKFIFASTCEIFNGAIDIFNWPVPTNEQVPAVFADLANPRWSYSLPKALAENYIQNAYSDSVIVRYFNVFGDQQIDHFMSEFINRCVKEKVYEIYGNDTRSFCYVEDACNMTINLASAPSGAYNIGREEEVSIESVSKSIMSMLGVDPTNLIIKPGKHGSVTRRCPDVSKYSKLFGEYDYTPFDAALTRTVCWYLDQLINGDTE